MADPTCVVLKNARREALIIFATWLAATSYCCGYYYLFGTSGAERPLGSADVKPVLGIPSWFLWGVVLPWCVCVVFTVWFAGFRMTDDDLGRDQPPMGEMEASEAVDLGK